MTLHELRQRYGEDALWYYIGALEVAYGGRSQLCLEVARKCCEEAFKTHQKQSPEAGDFGAKTKGEP